MQNQKFQTRLNKIQTEFIHLNVRNCKHCWKCVDVCPKNVIGKVSFLFHRHAIIRHSEDCTGCFKCVNTCEYGALKKGKLL